MRVAPLIKGLEFDWMGRNVGDIQTRQYFFCGVSVVVGRSTHQRESGEGDDGIDHDLTVFDEKFLDGGSRIQSRCKCGNDLQALYLKRGNHRIVVLGVVGQ